MHALLMDGDTIRPLHRTPLAATGSQDEKWLQALLFSYPELVPIDQIDPGAGTLVPICRELPVPKFGTNVYLDILAVSPHGRLVLVECKLWRNPQARREVIAQILEYAALLRHWTYADLTAKLIQTLGWSGPNPLFDHVRSKIPSLDEVRFVDAVSRSLLAADFDLIIAGDGIRSDLQTIAGHLNAQAGLASRLALVEFQIWSTADGETVIVPALPLRTQVIEHRVVMDRQGVPLPLAPLDLIDEAVETVVNPEQAVGREQDRAFWQRFIDSVRFDHPDQTPPRHGGRNWVRIDLPPPSSGMTAYRARGCVAGLFVIFAQELGAAAAFADLAANADQLRQETGLNLVFEAKQEQPFRAEILVRRRFVSGDDASDDRLLAWLQDATNRMVNTFRPRLAALTDPA